MKNLIQMLVLVCAMKSFFYPTILCIQSFDQGGDDCDDQNYNDSNPCDQQHLSSTVPAGSHAHEEASSRRNGVQNSPQTQFESAAYPIRVHDNAGADFEMDPSTRSNDDLGIVAGVGSNAYFIPAAAPGSSAQRSPTIAAGSSAAVDPA